MSPLIVNGRAVVIDELIAYMDINVVEGNLRMAYETYDTIVGGVDAMSMLLGLLQRDLPDGTIQLPITDGPFADAVRLEGRWREVIEGRWR